ncbi:MAG: hydroxyacid dehydrogenase [Pseudomonadota bacterium]
MADVVVTEFMDAEPLAPIEDRFSLHIDATLHERPQALHEAVGDARALIVRNRTVVDQAVLDAAPKLEVVGRLGVGLENIDLDACRKRDVEVCPARGANARAVAEYAVMSAMMLRRALLPAHRATAAGGWSRTDHGGGRESAEAMFGIIGLGDIGWQTALLAKAVGFAVQAFDVAPPPIGGQDAGVKTSEKTGASVPRVSLDQLLATSDVVSIHVPLTDVTRGLIDASRCSSMRPGAILINTARGGIVDEKALADALARGHLGGAALDVFASEPPSTELLSRFAELPNVLLTPHIAGLTAEANIRVNEVTVQNVLRVLTGE